MGHTVQILAAQQVLSLTDQWLPVCTLLYFQHNLIHARDTEGFTCSLLIHVTVTVKIMSC
ncbi:hypothetical protein D3C75_1282370 [compost metagenome]